MRNLKNIIFGLLSLGVSIIGSGQEIPLSYAKSDTIVSKDRTTITLYDSLDAPIYKEIKRSDGKSQTFYEYTPIKHKIKKKIIKNEDNYGKRIFTAYLIYKYNKTEENNILMKQYSYSENYNPDIFVIDKKRFRENKAQKEKKWLTQLGYNQYYNLT